MSTPSDPKAFWDGRFAAAGDGFVFGEQPNDFLVREVHRLSPGSRVLSVADGEGRNSVFLAEQGHQVEALEFAPAALRKAQGLARSRGVAVHFTEADVFDWAWPSAAYDAVVAIFVQFAPPDARARIFAHMIDALVPGGLLFLQGYTPRQLEFGTGGPSAAENLYTEELLLEAFADHETVLLRSHESVIDEGTGHKGMSALVDLVVRRS